MQVKKIADLKGHEASIYAIAHGPSSEKILTAGGDGWIVEWDFVAAPDLGKLVARTDGQLFSLLYIKEKNLVVAGDMNGGVRWIDLENPADQKNVAHHRKGVFSIQLIDNQVVTLGGDGILSRWDIEKRVARESVQLSSKSLRCLVFLKKKGLLAVGSSDGAIYFLDSKTLVQNRKIEAAHSPSVFSLAISEDEKRLFSGGRDARLKVWNLENGFENDLKNVADFSAEALAKEDLPAHNWAINAMSTDFSANILATASRDKTIKIWDLTSLELLKVIDVFRDGGHIRSVNSLLFTENQGKNGSKRLISTSDDRSAMVWEIHH